MNINGTIYKKPLLVFALESEAGRGFEGYEMLFTGIGKVNATYHLLKKIQEYRPDIIINLGTAGGFGFQKGEVICCTEFVQRDMDVSPLGFKKYQTPFSKSPIVLEYGIAKEGLKKGVCGTGDCFETEHTTNKYNVVDMEVYALAKVAKEEQIPFLCLKYISDGADDNAVTDWQEEVKLAGIALNKALLDIH
ncbi:MAG: nucleosidase [Flavobacteriales bacterium]|nr:MAG: nucleosidase [Flavobacteriales bacterium]